MIISFEEPAESLQGQDKNSLEALFVELCRIFIAGDHYIVISRSACSWAQSNTSLPESHRQALKSLSEKYAERGSLLRTCQWHIKIKFGTHGPEKRERHAEVGHIYFIKNNIKELPRLLVEDRNSDGEFFKLALNATSKKHHVKNWKAAIDNGGGSNIAKNFQALLDQNYITVAISDGDKYHPNDKTSDVNKKLDRAITEKATPGFLYALPCRDVENMIPAAIYLQHNIPHKINEDCRAVLIKIDYDTDADTTDKAWLYFDVKEGLKDTFLKKHKDNADLMSYLKLNVFDGGECRPIEGFSNGALTAFLNNPKALADFNIYTKSRLWTNLYKPLFDDALWILTADVRKFAF